MFLRFLVVSGLILSTNIMYVSEYHNRACTPTEQASLIYQHNPEARPTTPTNQIQAFPVPSTPNECIQREREITHLKKTCPEYPDIVTQHLALARIQKIRAQDEQIFAAYRNSAVQKRKEELLEKIQGLLITVPTLDEYLDSLRNKSPEELKALYNKLVQESKEKRRAEKASRKRNQSNTPAPTITLL